MDAAQTYVSMLQARRLDEVHSRVARSHRRATTVARNSEEYQRRANTVRRLAMDEKMRMTSRKEQEMFLQLSALTKWRLVMYENIVNREAQHAEAASVQERLYVEHLDRAQRQDHEHFLSTVRDDMHRFNTGIVETRHRKEKSVEDRCRLIANDILEAVNRHIAFIAEYNVAPTAGQRNIVPLFLSENWAREAALHDERARLESIAARHVSLTLYQAEPVDANSIHSKGFLALTQKMLRLKYPKPPPFKPIDPSPFPIAVLAGSKYCGKTSVAKAVAQSLGFICLSDADLVQSALAEFEREAPAEELMEALGAELLELGQGVQAALVSGQAVSPDLMTRIILHRLKTLPRDTPGLILDGTPSTLEGFASLERHLSGFDSARVTRLPEVLLAPPLDGVNPEDPSLNVEKTEPPQEAAQSATGKKEGKPAAKKKKDDADEPLPPIDLPVVEPIPELTPEEEAAVRRCGSDNDEASIHAVIHIHCKPEEIFRRFAGLRVDSETGKIYHVEVDPPPSERLPYLRPMDRVDADTAKLHRAVENHIERWEHCSEFFRHYDGVIHEVDGSRSLEMIIADVEAAALTGTRRAKEYFEQWTLAQEINQRRKEYEEMFAQRMAEREIARKQLALIYTERGADLPPELLEPAKLNETQFCSLPESLPTLFLDHLHAFTDYYSLCIHGATPNPNAGYIPNGNGQHDPGASLPRDGASLSQSSNKTSSAGTFWCY